MLGLVTMTALSATVSGTVTDAAGQPVDNAFVVIYDSRFQFEFAQTDAEGSYRIEGLQGDRTRVRILPPSSSYAAEVWAGGTLGACNAQAFEVGDEEDVVIDVALPEGASLSGTVVDGGVPVQGVRMSAKTRRGSLIAQTRFDFTDAEGAYEIRGITPDQDGVGSWTVEAQILDYPTQFFPGTYVADEGAAFDLAAGESDVVPAFDLRPGVTVSGRVTGPMGAVDGGEVAAFSASQSVNAPVAGGRYTARGLRPGDVLVWAYGEGLATTYYPSSPTPLQRIPLPEDGDIATGIDLVLPAESVLSARLAGAPFEATSVLVFNEAQTSAVGSAVEPDGSFAVGTLHSGRYLLFVDGVDDGFVEDFVRDDRGEPRVFSIDGPTDVGTVAVPGGASLSGVIRDRYTSEPIYGAAVVAHATQSDERRAATTDRDGAYVIDGLFADRWELRAEYQGACEADPAFVPTYYPDQRNPTLGGIIDFRVGDARTWDPLLGPDDDHDGMDDVWEAQYDLDTTRDDSAEDPDGDGFTNRDEYLLGTNPRDAGPTPDPGGCSCQSSPGAAWLVFLALPLLRRRRR